MIGPNVDIYTVNHPLTASGRRANLARVIQSRLVMMFGLGESGDYARRDDW